MEALLFATWPSGEETEAGESPVHSYCNGAGISVSSPFLWGPLKILLGN